MDGKYAQAFPDFGPERLGAPVSAFVRIDSEPIEIRSQIYSPNAVTVFEDSLLETVPITKGLVPKGFLVINSDEKGSPAVKKVGDEAKATPYAIDASKIAVELIGTPTVSTIMLGALAGASGYVTVESLESVVKQRFHGAMGETNAKMIRSGFKEVHKL